MASLSVATLSVLPKPGFHHFSAHRRFVIPRLPPEAPIRISAFSQGSGDLVADARNWSRISGFVIQDYGIGDYGDDEEDCDGDNDDDDEEEDRSLDLLVMFVQNMFKKISRKARKAVRSVLPISVSTKLIRFSVNGTIILAFLWILKAFLEVVCTLGSVVFVSILLIRGVWSWVAYLQDIRARRLDEEQYNTWRGAQPAS